MTRAPRIAVIGSTNMDVVTYCESVPRAGETVFGQQVLLACGGKGANQAVAAQLCGAQTHMVARVGADLFGTEMIRNLTAFGVDTSQVQAIEGTPSGAASILVESGGQNRIIVAKGANDLLTPQDVDAAAPVLAQADILILQFEVPLETVRHVARFARAHNIRFILNPAPAILGGFTGMGAVDYLVLNETEAEIMTGRPVQSVPDAQACAASLRPAGFEQVVLTLGAGGAVLASAAGAELVAPYKVDAVDTTGAGDAFIGSLAVSLAEGLSGPQAVARANLYAALSTTRAGTQQAFVTRAAFETEWRRRHSNGKNS